MTLNTHKLTHTHRPPNAWKVNKYSLHRGEFYLVSWKQNETTHTGDETILPWLGGAVFNNLWRGRVSVGGRKQLSQSKPWAERSASWSLHTDGGLKEAVSETDPEQQQHDLSYVSAGGVIIDIFLKNKLFKNVNLWMHLLPPHRPYSHQTPRTKHRAVRASVNPVIISRIMWTVSRHVTRCVPADRSVEAGYDKWRGGCFKSPTHHDSS